MHEVGLMERVLEVAALEAERRGAARFEGLTLRVGALSGAIPEVLEIAFASLSPGTCAEGATLTIVPVQGRLRCPTCRLEFDSDEAPALCPLDGAVTAEVLSGAGLELSRLVALPR